MIIITLSLLKLITADCQNFNFYCPDGGLNWGGPQKFTDGGCWNVWGLNCSPCTDVKQLIRTCCNCKNYACSGSIENWYARIDGCSGPI